MRLHGLATGVLAVLAAALCACGDAGDEPGRPPGTPHPQHVRAVERDPYALTCLDLARQEAHSDSARLVIHAEFELARVPELRAHRRRWTLNRTGRSVYFALTELCKGREPSFRPARAAVAAVREGRYLAARDRPG